MPVVAAAATALIASLAAPVASGVHYFAGRTRTESLRLAASEAAKPAAPAAPTAPLARPAATAANHAHRVPWSKSLPNDGVERTDRRHGVGRGGGRAVHCEEGENECWE